jgi:hypothetical protein
VNALLFTRSDFRFEARGPKRRSFVAYDELASPGRGGAGTVPHVAWTREDQDIEAGSGRLPPLQHRPPPSSASTFAASTSASRAMRCSDCHARSRHDGRRAARHHRRCVVVAAHARASKEKIEATLRPTSNPRRGRAAENLLSARTWRFTREHLPWLRAVRARV